MSAPTTAPPERGRTRQGSSCSDKQIGGAAARGRRVTFRFFTDSGTHDVGGYVVGMDDFHWMLACVVPFTERVDGQEPIEIVLVHKAQVPVALLHSLPTLDNEDMPVQEALRRVGGPFWNLCESLFTPKR